MLFVGAGEEYFAAPCCTYEVCTRIARSYGTRDGCQGRWSEHNERVFWRRDAYQITLERTTTWQYHTGNVDDAATDEDEYDDDDGDMCDVSRITRITNWPIKILTLPCPGFFYTFGCPTGGKITPLVYLEFCGT